MFNPFIGLLRMLQKRPHPGKNFCAGLPTMERRA
jgi:hypothetical protein